MSEAWIIDGVRSPRGKGKANGSLHHLHPQELLGQVLNAARERIGFDAADVDDVIIGNGNSTGDHANCIGRMSVLAAGWPVEATGVTLNRFCGSGQQAITFAAMGVQAGHQDLVVGGGVEMMSRWESTDAPPDFAAGNAALRALYPMVPQGVSADLIATTEGISREDVDAFALRSQERAAKAMAEGRFDRSVVPIHNADGTVALDRDEFPRPNTTLEGLAKLEPSFAKMGSKVFPGFETSFDDMCRQVYPEVMTVDHVHHAGNSSGVVDGAAVVVVASPDFARAHGLAPRARVVMSAAAGAEPVIMLTAPGPASAKCLQRAGMTVDDIDLWEINEAFATVPLKTIRDLGIDPDRVNVNGGAIALGHPIGATGAMLIQTALDELERQDKSTALITMCTGGGMGTATIIERI
ncbi:acetyl-CoA C-acetyltransferase [Acidiferrimicrobium sp. IK]|uniref:acetyl-CoA C-acetyltransferase n=1 Tax=Acidiferrimicrobium sp. IK TaxID=2871700 RepID=UPI0021CB618C|nr:acetyl-CoA C-acetyltransferase [Acidiferrimicrobium sp. IK]MCU4183489.1 acetyl-CoA C-acetyltransferase [Acidiferrimicrobium sp. IK]